MTHTNAWNVAIPAQTDPARYGALRVRTLKIDVQQRLALEHIFGISTTTDGQHKPGLCGICYVGTTAEVEALAATAPNGSLAFDITLGVFKYMVTGVWYSVSVTGFTGSPSSLLLTDTGETTPNGRFRILCDEDIVSVDTYSDALAWETIFQFKRDGTCEASGDVVMGGSKVTGLGDATINGDALRYEHKTAATLDHPDLSVTAAKLAAGIIPALGTWAVKANDTSYLAETDGFVVGWGDNLNGYLYTDASNPPTTARWQCVTGGGAYSYSFFSPVKKGQYWKADFTQVPTAEYGISVFWIPFGS